MIKLYTFSITDYKGESVMHSTQKFANNRQAAAVATKLMNQIPPAMGIKIHAISYTAKDLAALLNEQLDYSIDLDNGWLTPKYDLI